MSLLRKQRKACVSALGRFGLFVSSVSIDEDEASIDEDEVLIDEPGPYSSYTVSVRYGAADRILNS